MSETLTQVGLIAQLRWRIFRNSMRSTRAKLEVVAQVLLLILAGLIVAGVGLGLYAAGFFITERGRYPILIALLWGIFLAWQILPMMVAASTSTFDFRELLRFPIRFSAFLILSLAYSLFDPVALAVLFWMICLAAGIATARPDLLPWVVPAFLGLAAVSLLLSRAILSALERLFARRRGREMFFMVFVLLMLGIQVLGTGNEEAVKAVVFYIASHPQVAMVFPPGLAYAAIEAGIEGEPLAALTAVFVLGLYTVLFLLLLRRRLRAQYHGEDLGASSSPGKSAATVATTRLDAGWRLPALAGPQAAMVEKEFRYISRNGFMMMNMAIPLFIPALFSMMPSRPDRTPFPLQGDSAVMYFGCVMYAMLVLVHLASNHFAFEGRGIQFLLTAPVRMRQVAAAKNLTHACIIAVETALIWAVLAAFGRPPTWMGTLVTLAAVPFLFLAQVTVGNLLSLHFPRRFDFGRFKQRQSGMAVLIILVQQVIAVGIAGGIFALARWMDRLWMAGVAFLVLGAAMWQVYRIGLDYYESLAARKREALTAELCHD